jgi:rod shape-determining protein MreB
MSGYIAQAARQERIREETGLPVSIADDPLASVLLGTGKMLSDFRLLRQVCID